MIDFRYHIVSLIAVFLALALGLFLGSTTLQSTVTRNLDHQADRLTGDNKTLNAQKSILTKQVGAEQRFTAAVEQDAVSGRLTGETVAMVSAPGVAGGIQDALVNTLQEAGATVTATVSLQAAFLDPTQDAELGSLASAIAPNHQLPQGNGATQAASVLAQILVTRPSRRAPATGKVTTALSALADGKFIKVAGTPPTHLADLAVVLVPAPTSAVTAAAAQAQNAILTRLTGDLRAASSGTVIAGPRPAAGGDQGALTAARNDSSLAKSVSTIDLDPKTSTANLTADPDLVDGGDPVVGRIAIILALAAQPTRSVGSFGLEFNPPLPTPSATP